MKTAARIENALYFVKCSVFLYNSTGIRGSRGDDGIVYELTKKEFGGNGGNKKEGMERCFIDRDDLLQQYGVILLKNGGLGKDLSRIPRETLRAVLMKLRQESVGSTRG